MLDVSRVACRVYELMYHIRLMSVSDAVFFCRSTYYIRDFTAEDFGTYRCFGTVSGDRVIYMEVDFNPDRLSGDKVTDIVFTAENAF